jgi:hypothetical protein
MEGLSSMPLVKCTTSGYPELIGKIGYTKFELLDSMPFKRKRINSYFVFFVSLL